MSNKKIKTKILEKVIYLVATAYKIDPTTINIDTSFQNDLALDSMSLVMSIVEIEDEYDVEIPERRLFKMRTIGDLVDFLEQSVSPATKAKLAAV